MEWYNWVIFIVTLPIILAGAAAVVYFIYVAWVLLFAICGLERAQKHFDDIT